VHELGGLPMRFHSRFAAALAAVGVLALTSHAQPTAWTVAASGTGPPLTPARLSLQTAVVVVGKVVDIEKDSVFVSRSRGARKDQKVECKIPPVQIVEPLIGGRGLTQFRVGFPADTSAAALPPLPGRGPLALAADQEGCFFLNPHYEADFYILASGPL